jgi:hypothetical protein
VSETEQAEPVESTVEVTEDEEGLTLTEQVAQTVPARAAACDDCHQHWEHDADALTAAFATIAVTREQPTLEIANQYFDRYHERGHTNEPKDDE